MKITIRTIYLYLFSAIGLIISIIAVINILDLVLRSVVFTRADEAVFGYMAPRMITDETSQEITNPEYDEKYARDQATSQKQREVSNSLAMILVGAPLYLYHWKTIQKKSIS